IGTPGEIYDDPVDEFVASFLGTPPMNLIECDGGSMGFRPENFLPKELLNGAPVVELPFRIDRVEYLGSEHILYGALDGRVAKREVTAKLPAHATLDGISPGAWHEFAVRETELRFFDRDGRRTDTKGRDRWRRSRLPRAQCGPASYWIGRRWSGRCSSRQRSSTCWCWSACRSCLRFITALAPTASSTRASRSSG